MPNQLPNQSVGGFGGSGGEQQVPITNAPEAATASGETGAPGRAIDNIRPPQEEAGAATQGEVGGSAALAGNDKPLTAAFDEIARAAAGQGTGEAEVAAPPAGGATIGNQPASKDPSQMIREADFAGMEAHLHARNTGTLGEETDRPDAEVVEGEEPPAEPAEGQIEIAAQPEPAAAPAPESPAGTPEPIAPTGPAQPPVAESTPAAEPAPITTTPPPVSGPATPKPIHPAAEPTPTAEVAPDAAPVISANGEMQMSMEEPDYEAMSLEELKQAVDRQKMLTNEAQEVWEKSKNVSFTALLRASYVYQSRLNKLIFLRNLFEEKRNSLTNPTETGPTATGGQG